MSNTGITRKRWTTKQVAEAIKTGQVEGRTKQAVRCKLNELGLHGRFKKGWTEEQIETLKQGGKPAGHSDNAIYQMRHKLHVNVPINKHFDPKHPTQTNLVFPASRKNPPKHHYESVGELLQPIYAMYNSGMKVDAIAKTIHQSEKFVESAIAMKTEFKHE